jgi:hypothetical protein
MPICENCGQETEFRSINGRCVPIHPGGGWHGSARSDPNATKPTGVRDWALREETLCRPATCPECGEGVFFIRHNGGSVWMDELGWPWPKHACFDKPTEATRNFTLWSTKSSRLTNPMLGTVNRMWNDPRFAHSNEAASRPPALAPIQAPKALLSKRIFNQPRPLSAIAAAKALPKAGPRS